MIKICELCKKDFIVNPKNKRSYNKRFCSTICATKNNGFNNKGRKHTEQLKISMSIKNSGINNPFYGKSHSDDTKKKISINNTWTESNFKHCEFSNT